MRRLINQWFELKEGLAIAWDAIRANKMRSALTTLGIVIGIVTVTLMGTAIEGINAAFHNSISIIGADTLFVNRMNWMIQSEEEWLSLMKRRNITLRQARQVQAQLTRALAVAPAVSMSQTVQYKRKSASSVQIIGTTDQYLITSGFSMGDGRYMTAAESDGGRPVCVIGCDVADKLFEGDDPVGKQLKVGSRTLEVIGVLAKQGKLLGLESLDNEIIVPIPKFLEAYWRNPDFQIQVKARSVAELEELKEELRGILRKIRRVPPNKPDDFAINQQDMLVKAFNNIGAIIGSVGLVITGLSLFVGGIGIMNIMFVSVAERTREIGVRKAIGAKRRTILLQFLVEAAAICLMGGLIGLAISYPLTLLGSQFIPLKLSLPVAGLAIAVSLVTGVVSGFLPAWRAARMDPVEALRNE